MAAEVVEADSLSWDYTAAANASLQPGQERVLWATAATSSLQPGQERVLCATSYEVVVDVDPEASPAAAAVAVAVDDVVGVVLLGGDRRQTHVCT